MLGKQWLNSHIKGSLIDRSRHREFRMGGRVTWRFKIIMECLPLMQVSHLLGYATGRLLNGKEAAHHYRYDLKSLFYIMLILATHYEIQLSTTGKNGGLRTRLGLEA